MNGRDELDETSRQSIDVLDVEGISQLIKCQYSGAFFRLARNHHYPIRHAHLLQSQGHREWLIAPDSISIKDHMNIICQPCAMHHEYTSSEGVDECSLWCKVSWLYSTLSPHGAKSLKLSWWMRQGVELRRHISTFASSEILSNSFSWFQISQLIQASDRILCQREFTFRCFRLSVASANTVSQRGFDNYSTNARAW